MMRFKMLCNGHFSSSRVALVVLIGVCFGGTQGIETGVSAESKDQTASQNVLPSPRAPLPKGEGSKKVQALIRDLSSDSLQARVAAADALARLGPEAKPAIPAMLQAMDGKHSWVDFAMMDGLSTLGRTSLPVLMETFADPKSKLRIPAGRALWTMGGAAAEAIPLLKKIIAEKDEKVLSLAQSTLKKIEAELNEAGKPAAGPASDLPSASSSTAATSEPQDWPGFHGRQRDSICRETGLLRQWPDEGLKLLWKLEGLGKGLSMVSIAGGKMFTTGDRAIHGQPEAQYVLAFDLASRKQLWAARIGKPYAEWGGLCTPTIDGQNAYVLSTDGGLFCLDAATGAVRWQKNLKDKEFGGQMMCVWPYSESPLVDGDRLICTPGGKEAAVVALDKKTGAVLWKCKLPEIGPQGKDGAAYASPMVAEIEGVRQYVQIVGRGVIGVEADSGAFLWGYNRLASDIANITNPVVRGSYVFATNSYNTGSALLRIRREGAKFRAEEVYFLAPKEFQNHHGGVVLVDGAIYGGSGMGKGDPACIDFATGKILWKSRAPVNGSAAVLYADGHLIFRYDRGLLMLVEAKPDALRIKGKFTPVTVEGPAWSHPVIHQKKLFLRHNDLLLCYDLIPGA